VLNRPVDDHDPQHCFRFVLAWDDAHAVPSHEDVPFSGKSLSRQEIEKMALSFQRAAPTGSCRELGCPANSLAADRNYKSEGKKERIDSRQTFGPGRLLAAGAMQIE